MADSGVGGPLHQSRVRSELHGNDDLELVTLRPVPAGEEFTISYNEARPREVLPPWDPHWTFVCQYGATLCQQRVEVWLAREA